MRAPASSTPIPGLSKITRLHVVEGLSLIVRHRVSELPAVWPFNDSEFSLSQHAPAGVEALDQSSSQELCILRLWA